MTVPLDWQASAWPLDRALSIERALFPRLPSKEEGVAKLRREGGLHKLRHSGRLAGSDGTGARGKVQRPPPLRPPPTRTRVRNQGGR